MGVIADMILTVAVVAMTTGAIPKFQFRVGHVGAATYGAAVVIIHFFLGEADGLGRFGGRICGFGCFLLFGRFPEPRGRQQIQHVLAHEQEVVADGDQRVQEVGEGPAGGSQGVHLQYGEDQVHQSKQPGFHRDDEHQQKLCLGEQGSIIHNCFLLVKTLKRLIKIKLRIIDFSKYLLYN